MPFLCMMTDLSISRWAISDSRPEILAHMKHATIRNGQIKIPMMIKNVNKHWDEAKSFVLYAILALTSSRAETPTINGVVSTALTGTATTF